MEERAARKGGGGCNPANPTKRTEENNRRTSQQPKTRKNKKNAKENPQGKQNPHGSMEVPSDAQKKHCTKKSIDRWINIPKDIQNRRGKTTGREKADDERR